MKAVLCVVIVLGVAAQFCSALSLTRLRRQCRFERMRSSIRARPGSYTPQCDESGNYKATQTHGSTGYSWCVDVLSGEKIKGTEVPPGSDLPQCKDCEKMRVAVENIGMIGSDPPECTDDGNFAPLQTHGSTGHSWCVDARTGEEVEGTRVGPGNDLPSCDQPEPPVDILTCAEKRDQLPERPPPGMYTPQCDEYGNYVATQFHGSTGYSWCVDVETGEKHEGTDVAPGNDAPQCRDCEKKFEVVQSMGLVGSNPPECTNDGNYAPMQRHGSTGHSWCVDRMTGEEIEGTRVGPNEDQPVCEEPVLLTCAQKRDQLPENPAPGQFVPQCDEYGNYVATQHHGSTGHVWCVDANTGEKLEGSDTPPGSDPPHCRDCEQKRKVVMSLSLVGSDPPECAEDGNYAPMQTHASIGHSWCADTKTGVEIEGTRVGPTEHLPVCEEMRLTCEERRTELLAMARPGLFIPQCDEFGNYVAIQTHGSTGYTFCVDVVSGETVEGTAMAPGSDLPECKACQKKLAVVEKLGRRIGMKIPQCGEDGNYLSTQMHGSTGHSWCVDLRTGAEIEGTRVGPGQGEPNCDSAIEA